MFQCKDLFNLPSLSNVKLLCGNGGLSNTIRWAYKAESQDIKNWVKGNELLIISGAIIDKKDFNLSSLILEAIDLHLSGALILVGDNYIKSLSKSTIKICNDKNFPIFLISWSTPLINVFEELGHAIILSSQINQNTDGFLGNILFGETLDKESLLIKASELDYPLDGNHSVFVINLFNTSIPESSKLVLDQFLLSELLEKISSLLKERKLNPIVSSFGTNIVGIFTETSLNNKNSLDNSSDEFKENSYNNCSITHILSEFMDNILISHPNISMNAGIGNSYSSINLISKSFKEASKSISICTKLKYRNKILSYKDLGIIQVFCEIEDTALLKNYRNEMLEPLIIYDKKNSSCLIQTLKIYLNNNCNIIHTSQILDTHRNTIKYRINRIEEILGISLNDSFTKLNLYNALLIHSFVI